MLKFKSDIISGSVLMKIKSKSLCLISRFVLMLVLLCIIPSGAFASVNNSTFSSIQNVTDENFTSIQNDLLFSISEQIAELQNLYQNVSEASNSSELQEVLSSYSSANGCEPDGLNKQFCGVREGFCGASVYFNLYQVENVTDYNYADVKPQIIDSLGNMTEMLKIEQINVAEAGDNNKAKNLEERIIALEYLSDNISATSDAAELHKVVLSYLKCQADDSIENEIELLEANVSDIENNTYDINEDIIELTDKISQLTSQREKINGAESITDLKEIMASSQVMSEMDYWSSEQYAGFDGCDCPMYYSILQDDNNTHNCTE